ncbi:60S ribosomal protein L24 [Aspergillus alliaceus]|uniref:60S ribosomal protein L24 n=2 Tax=Petromyces alliaceus TaxID=209559 RepID=A0A8H6AB47_PETAA|nr:60S ribosomal protein L24 [Aspergillus burnettii]
MRIQPAKFLNQEANPDITSEDLTAQLGTALSLDGTTPKTSDINAATEEKPGEGNISATKELPRIGSFKRRLKATFTGSPLKQPGNPNRHSCHIHSRRKTGRSQRSGPVTASFTGSNTTGSIHSSPTKKSPQAAALSVLRYLRYIRANNDAFLLRFLDFLESESSGKNGSLIPMEGAKQHVLGANPSDRKSPWVETQDTKKRDLKKQIEHVHSLTGTQVKTASPTDTKSRRRADNSRVWNTVNLRCTTCRGNCPVCGVACCKYADAQQTISKTESKSENADHARQGLQMIEGLGSHVKDMSTFSLCTRLRTAPTIVSAFREQPRRSDRRNDSTTQRQPTTSRCASPTFKMRTYDDSFSGQKIYPGKGKLYVRGDSKIFRFQNGKSESLFLQRKNPRRISWTVLYRRQHKKGISEEVAKKRTRRVVKSQRAIVGASLEVIKERRNQRPEARAAARQQAIKDAKEKKAASEKAKKANNAAGKGTAQRIQSKQGAKGSAPKVAAKSR